MNPAVITILSILLLGAASVNAQELLGVPRAPTSVAVDSLFVGDALWSNTAASLEKEWRPNGFRWSSTEAKNNGVIRRDNRGLGPNKITAFHGTRELEEVGFSLKEGKLIEVTISIWNKGDSQNPLISQKDFIALIEAWSNDLNQTVAPKFENRGKDRTSATKAERRLWVGTNTLAQMEYSASMNHENIFQGEFIRLRMLPKIRGSAAFDASSQGVKRLADLKKSLTTNPAGDVWITGIPMIDQGDKGYCAVASSARVFNYLGVDVDQHEMAQVVGNQAGGGGTNPQAMEEALRRITIRYKTRFQKLLDYDLTSRKYQSFLIKYNTAAKKAGKPMLDTKNYIYTLGGLDPDVLREVKGKGVAYDKFMELVRSNIDKGMPMMWGLELGIYRENGQAPRQAKGGHMRLIIGYNLKTNEIIFSDSWGAGHEKNRMSAADAAAATMAIFVIQIGQ